MRHQQLHEMVGTLVSIGQHGGLAKILEINNQNYKVVKLSTDKDKQEILTVNRRNFRVL